MAPLLILHGWGSCAKNWTYIKDCLERNGYKVFVPDLPGFGENSKLIKSWSLDDYVEWVKEFCEKNNLSQVFLLGHSFGGAVAVKFSLKYPERIKKMFLLANSGIRRKSFKKEALKRIAGFLRIFSFLPFYSFIRKVFYKIFISKSDYPYAEEKKLRETYLKVIKEDISSCFSQVLVSTVIIWGSKDIIVPIKDAYFINQEIRCSRLIVIPDVGHNLASQTPETLIKKIIEHIK